MPDYGSVADVKELLSATDSTTFGTAETARITDLLPVVSRLIEDDTGAVFGVSTTETIVVEPDVENGPVLFLPKPIRSVTSITEHPDWVSGAWTGGTVLTTNDYRLAGPRGSGAYGQIVHMTGAWAGTYVITGVWEDKVAAVPAEITYAANFIAAEIYKAQSASPHGLLGPELAMVPIRKAFQVDEIRRILDKHRVGPSLVAV